MTADKPVNIVAIMWGSYVPAFLAAAEDCPEVTLSLFSQKEIGDNADLLERFWACAESADAILFLLDHRRFLEEVSAA